ncbi:MAG TPA: carbohydrate-binding protein [Clostridiales bacterium]|nr:carbohydrate-binding protein [Clostridiales bacterium]
MNERKTRNLDYLDKGVAISPALPVVGDKITVFYDGILAKNGAEEITLHLGYGSNWDNEQAIPMVKKDTGFEATIPALKEDYLKLSFKDTFNNVDDNNGKGYSIEILK